LCTGKTHEQIELLELDKSGIHVAEYITTLPPKAELQKKLHQSIEFARQRFVNKD
jgi:macrodomain Ter protein organizer (MatP/YcbG family)